MREPTSAPGGARPRRSASAVDEEGAAAGQLHDGGVALADGEESDPQRAR